MRTDLSMLTAIVLAMTTVSGAEAAQAKHHKASHATTHHSRTQKGKISYYHPRLAGKKMANGEAFRPDSNAAASKTLPLGTKAKVTNLQNGKSETVEVKDRGPVVPGRVMDVSPATADKLDMKKEGAVPAEITPITGSAQ
ncbi:MAG: septal ring lytic transglycosylase RlpA family protein [Rhodospirillales bacterium]|nr:septal ring lytic transglycosylase RlpA family protein [Rhodospirillales bacterium]